LLTLAAAAIYSCSDAFDIAQEGEYVEDIAFRELSDLSLFLTEIYDNVDNEDIIAFTSVFTDETAIGDENGGQNQAEYRHQLFSTNGYANSIWLNNYSVINYVNRLIAGADQVILDPESATFDDDVLEKNRILAEARTLRAFCTLQLLTFYSTDLTNDSALGVIILDHVPPTLPNLEQLPRSTNLECFNFINQDLDYANTNLSASTVPTFVSKAMVLAIRARMAIYRKHYTEALQYSQEAIAAKTLAGAQGANQGLALPATYPSTWTDESVAELIFTAPRPIGKSGIVNNWFFNTATYDGGAFLDMGRNLYRDLTQYPTDIRDNSFVGASSLIAPDYATVFDYQNADVIVIGKYPGTPAQNLPLNNNLKVMRTVEMHYIKAEAQIATGDLEGARTTLNFVRRIRTAGTTAASLATPTAASSANHFPAFTSETQA
ncbi:MAG: RagB/SusD family nutrient uptake outer membrane protein, partial [Pedobacter sp.]